MASGVTKHFGNLAVVKNVSLTASETRRMVASCHRKHLPIADVMERAEATGTAQSRGWL